MAGRWGPNFFHIFTFLKFRNLFSGQGQRNVSFLTFFVILGIRQSFRDGICQDPFNQIFGIGFDLVWSLENTNQKNLFGFLNTFVHSYICITTLGNKIQF